MTREEKEQWDIFMKTWVIPALKNTWNEKKCKEIVEALEEWEEQGSVLDKIKADIEQMDFDFGDYYDHTDEIIEMVCKVIDKYRLESED